MAAAHIGVPIASLPGWSGSAAQPSFARRDDIGTLISGDRTASIPPEAVGEGAAPAQRSRVTSILDILLGN